MNPRGLRRYIDDLLRGRRPKPFHPDEFEAAQIRTAIDLQAARLGSDAPRQEFLTDLRSRLAAQHNSAERPAPEPSATRRNVIVGTSAAAAAAVAAVSIDRALVDSGQSGDSNNVSADQLTPDTGRWMRVAGSAELTDGIVRPFDLGTVIGFVRRVDGKPEAVSGMCTHQGCRLWFDAPDDRLRCPCHSTSFSPAGRVLTHQLPIAPKPLPTLMVREHDGAIEVFVPPRSDKPPA
jgi:cytochrome b6-f complex iron-sulfur subunit